MEQPDIDMNNHILKDVLNNLYATIVRERRASSPYKNLFKKSDDIAIFLNDINDRMMEIVLDATQILRDKYGTCPIEAYNILKALPLITDNMVKKIEQEEGMSCCVDKTYYLLSQKINELLKPEETLFKTKEETEKMKESVIVLNNKFEETDDWRAASYAIYDGEEVELYNRFDTPYPIISADEIQKLAKLTRKEKPKASIQIFLHLYDKWRVSPVDTEVLENLEDSIRDFLHSKGFGEFNIEDGYTGNSTVGNLETRKNALSQ